METKAKKISVNNKITYTINNQVNEYELNQANIHIPIIVKALQDGLKVKISCSESLRGFFEYLPKKENIEFLDIVELKKAKYDLSNPNELELFIYEKTCPVSLKSVKKYHPKYYARNIIKIFPTLENDLKELQEKMKNLAEQANDFKKKYAGLNFVIYTAGFNNSQSYKENPRADKFDTSIFDKFQDVVDFKINTDNTIEVI